jgi:CHAD domain-containing protein
LSTVSPGYVRYVTEPSVHQEIEKKLDVPTRFRLPSLADGVGKVVTRPTLRLTAVYYDTADLRLARSKITMRRRFGGVDDGWHLKLPHDDSGARDELRLPLDAIGNPPAEFTTLTLGITRGDVLGQVATLRTERRPLGVNDEHGAPLAELTDDRVSVSIGRKVVRRFRELEVEAAEGRTADDLGPIVAALLAAGATKSAFSSKLVRALGEQASRPADVPTVRQLRPRDAAGDVIQNHIAQQVSAFIESDLRLRRDLPDAVHQLRVTARRLRSTLKVFAPMLDTEWAEHLREDLAWIADELGASRDNEVLKERLLSGLGALDEKGTAQAAKVVRRELSKGQQATATDVAEAMRSTRYLDLLDSLVEAASAPRLSEAAATKASTALPPLMRSTWRRLSRSVHSLRQNGADDDWHAARIRAKQARYAAEALVPVFGRPAKRLAKQLERITELLGAHQDAAVAAHAAKRLASSKGISGRAGYALGLLHEAQRAEVRQTRRELKRIWPKVAKPRHRHWLRDG